MPMLHDCVFVFIEFDKQRFGIFLSIVNIVFYFPIFKKNLFFLPLVVFLL